MGSGTNVPLPFSLYRQRHSETLHNSPPEPVRGTLWKGEAAPQRPITSPCAAAAASAEAAANVPECRINARLIDPRQLEVKPLQPST